MQVAIWTDPGDVDTALDRLGLTVKPLLNAILAGHLIRINCTENDAPNAPGFMHWNGTLRTLREELVPAAWTRCNAGGFSTTVSPTGKIAVAVASGNENTGIRGAIPTTKSPKGPNTASAVQSNAAQLDLFAAVISTLSPEAPERVTWFLLFHNDGKELRGELSLPVTMGEGGHIGLWRERIILPAQPLDTSFVLPQPDFGPDLDIDVRKRA